MSDEPKPTPTPSLVMQILGLLKRPIEYGLTGAALVGVLFLANKSEILPKVFKGAGFEVEFQERVIQTTADTEQGIKVLRASLKDLKAEVTALRAALEASGPVMITEEMVAQAEPEQSLQEDADGASKDSLLVDQDQLIQTEGFMWLGTFDPALNEWTDRSVQLLNGKSLPHPDALSDQALVLTTTVNIREGYPANDQSYFRSVRAMGIAETATRATLLAVPQSYDREGVQQIWGHVDVVLRPYFGLATAN